MKNRILLFFFYQAMSFVSLIDPRPGHEIITDHNAAEKRRRDSQRAAGAVRVGDRV
jgi:hypothetical protein